MIVLGITGNIGMGKSSVARLFEELGAVRIDTDAVVSDLLGDPEVIQEFAICSATMFFATARSTGS